MIVIIDNRKQFPKPVVPKLFQFTEHLDVMLLSAERREKLIFMAFEITTMLLAESTLSYYIMAYQFQQIIISIIIIIIIIIII
jgi:hypothetical protein